MKRLKLSSVYLQPCRGQTGTAREVAWSSYSCKQTMNVLCGSMDSSEVRVLRRNLSDCSLLVSQPGCAQEFSSQNSRLLFQYLEMRGHGCLKDCKSFNIVLHRGVRGLVCAGTSHCETPAKLTETTHDFIPAALSYVRLASLGGRVPAPPADAQPSDTGPAGSLD